MSEQRQEARRGNQQLYFKFEVFHPYLSEMSWWKCIKLWWQNWSTNVIPTRDHLPISAYCTIHNCNISHYLGKRTTEYQTEERKEQRHRSLTIRCLSILSFVTIFVKPETLTLVVNKAMRNLSVTQCRDLKYFNDSLINITLLQLLYCQIEWCKLY